MARKDDEPRIEFGTLDESGGFQHSRTLRQSAVGRCRHFILDPQHYREDESCRCDDPTHTIMAEWGYEFGNGLWR